MPRPRIQLVSPRRVETLLEAEGLDALLSEEEQEVFGGFRFQSRRRDWLAGRLAAKLLIRRTLGTADSRLPLQAFSILNAASGAPFFADDTRWTRDWSLSIAHAEGYGACTVAHHSNSERVGIDLEPERQLPAASLRAFLTATERRRLRRHGTTGSPSPLMLWTIKEAILKADGRRRFVCMREIELAWEGRARIGERPGEDALGLAVRFSDASVGDPSIAVGIERRGSRLLSFAVCREPEV